MIAGRRRTAIPGYEPPARNASQIRKGSPYPPAVSILLAETFPGTMKRDLRD